MCAESEQQVATWAVKIGLLGGWNVPSQCFYSSLHLLRALTIWIPQAPVKRQIIINTKLRWEHY